MLGPYVFASKPFRTKNPDEGVHYLQVPIALETTEQQIARFKAYTDPLPEVKPGKPKFVKQVSNYPLGGYR